MYEIELLTFLAAGFFSLAIFKKKPKSRLVNISMLTFLSLVAFLVIDTQLERWIFTTTLVIAYVTDILAVYLNVWTYNTRSGYAIWTGMGWAVIAVILYNSLHISYFGILLYMLPCLVFLLKPNNKQRGLPENFSQFCLLSLRISLFFTFPKLFLLCFATGIYLEYISMEVFDAWDYDDIGYIFIGSGYGLLIISAIVLGSFLSGVTFEGYQYLGLLLPTISYLIFYFLKIWKFKYAEIPLTQHL